MLRETLKEVTSHSLIYSIGWFANSFAGILLLPVYTRFLSTEDYGILEMTDLTKGVLTAFIVAGLNSAIGKFYSDAQFGESKNTVISTSLFFIVVSAGIWIFFTYIFNDQISILMLGGIEYVALVNIFIASLFFEILLMVNLIVFQVKALSRVYVYISSSKLIINILFNLLFILVLKLGAKGMLFGNLISSALFGMYLTIYHFRKHGYCYDFRLQKEMLQFGAPFIPALLGGLCMHSADRYILRIFTSLEVVAIYSLGYKFPFMVSSLLINSFNQIWRTKTVFSVASEADAPFVYAKVTTYFVAVFVVLQYFLAVFAPTMIILMAAPDYREADKVLPVVALAVCFFCLHNFFITGALVTKKTKFVPLSALIASLVNISLNWYFIPKFGFIAAAWSSVATYFVYSFVGYRVYRKIYRINFDFPRLLFLIVLSILLGCMASLVSFDSFAFEFAKEIFFAMLLPAILIKSSFFRPEEKVELFFRLKQMVKLLKPKVV